MIMVVPYTMAERMKEPIMYRTNRIIAYLHEYVNMEQDMTLGSVASSRPASTSSGVSRNVPPESRFSGRWLQWDELMYNSFPTSLLSLPALVLHICGGARSRTVLYISITSMWRLYELRQNSDYVARRSRESNPTLPVS